VLNHAPCREEVLESEDIAPRIIWPRH
jgi:hypothetical protein